jgi:hypothetical protein
MPGKSYEVPGASLGDSYIMPGAPDGDALLAAELANTGAALDAWAADEAALPPDPGLINARNAIANEYAAAKDNWARRRAAHLADPRRARYKPTGLTALDTEFESTLQEERTALRDRLNARLDVVERSVLERYDGANVVPVGDEDENGATRFALRLGIMTPRNGVPVLADFVRAATDNPALAFEALPLLRSIHERRGEWQGNWDLARAIETFQKVVEARPGLARARADLALLDETRRQLGHLEDASTSAVADRYVHDGAGNEVPVAGRAGFGLEWTASPTTKEMFGDGPSLSGREPVVVEAAGGDDIDKSWRPAGGVTRGQRPADEA